MQRLVKGRNELPVAIAGSASVPYGDTFLLVGGHVEFGIFYQFVPSREDWMVMNGGVDNGAYLPVAMLITPTDVASTV